MLFRPDQGDLSIPNPEGRLETQLATTSEFAKQSLIYSPQPMVWVDRNAYVAAAPIAENVYDAVSWESRTTVTAGGNYVVRAELTNPTVEELRSAGEQYPAWIQDRDLEVPAGLREEFRTLAGTAAVGQENPYDEAAAITNYLRSNLQYSTSVPAPPGGQDPTLWVLQTYKKGFCNYYASAEVLMLRSLGIPARLAVGFAQGELEGDTYVVHRRDAHAWPEVYFPGIGWVEFEPTVSQDPLIRPSGVSQTSAIPTNPQPRGPTAREEGAFPETGQANGPVGFISFVQTAIGRLLLVTVPFLLSGAVLLALIYDLGFWRRLPGYVFRAFEGNGNSHPAWVTAWKRWQQIEPIERAFASINWSLVLLQRPQPLASTPAERAKALAGLVPTASEQIWALERELESGLFAPRVPDLARARRASFVILVHSVRRRIQLLLSTVNGRDVYS